MVTNTAKHNTDSIINLLKKFLSYTKRTAILITINVTLFAVSTDVVKAFWSALHTV